MGWVLGIFMLALEVIYALEHVMNTIVKVIEKHITEEG